MTISLTPAQAAWIKWSVEQAREYMYVYGDGFEEADWAVMDELQELFAPYDFEESDDEE